MGCRGISLGAGTFSIDIQPQSGNTDYEFYINATTPQSQSQLLKDAGNLADAAGAAAASANGYGSNLIA